MQKAMGVDQSLSCTGVVITEIDDVGNRKVIHSESIQTVKTHHTCPIADTITRAVFIADRLKQIVHEYDPDWIGLENLSYGSVGNATRNLAILFGVICSALGLKAPRVVPPTTLKKFATGNGRAGKKEMLAAIEATDPIFFQTLNNMTIKAGKYDLADAYWIARWVVANPV